MKLFGSLSQITFSPIVTIEPRRRKFHCPIKLKIPLPPGYQTVGRVSGGEPSSKLHLLCSIAGGQNRAQWEDVTGSTPLTLANDECLLFTTTVSARFWLIHCQQQQHCQQSTRLAQELYRHLVAVPFMAKFVLFAKRRDINESNLRVFCMTDDKEERTLEVQEHYSQVAKSKDVEVLEGQQIYLEIGGNLLPSSQLSRSLGGSGALTFKSSSSLINEQLSFQFNSFQENRLAFCVRVKDVGQEPSGKIAFMEDSIRYLASLNAQQRAYLAEKRRRALCTLSVVLPPMCVNYDNILGTPKRNSYYANTRIGDLSLADIANELNAPRRQLNANEEQDDASSLASSKPALDDDSLLGSNLNSAYSARRSRAHNEDWVELAPKLGIPRDEVDYIIDYCQANQICAANRGAGKALPQSVSPALILLMHWFKLASPESRDQDLARALVAIGRADIAQKLNFPIEAKKISRSTMELLREIELIPVRSSENLYSGGSSALNLGGGSEFGGRQQAGDFGASKRRSSSLRRASEQFAAADQAPQVRVSRDWSPTRDGALNVRVEQTTTAYLEEAPRARSSSGGGGGGKKQRRRKEWRKFGSWRLDEEEKGAVDSPPPPYDGGVPSGPSSPDLLRRGKLAAAAAERLAGAPQATAELRFERASSALWPLESGGPQSERGEGAAPASGSSPGGAHKRLAGAPDFQTRASAQSGEGQRGEASCAQVREGSLSALCEPKNCVLSSRGSSSSSSALAPEQPSTQAAPPSDLQRIAPLECVANSSEAPLNDSQRNHDLDRAGRCCDELAAAAACALNVNVAPACAQAHWGAKEQLGTLRVESELRWGSKGVALAARDPDARLAASQTGCSAGGAPSGGHSRQTERASKFKDTGDDDGDDEHAEGAAQVGSGSTGSEEGCAISSSAAGLGFALGLGAETKRANSSHGARSPLLAPHFAGAEFEGGVARKSTDGSKLLEANAKVEAEFTCEERKVSCDFLKSDDNNNNNNNGDSDCSENCNDVSAKHSSGQQKQQQQQQQRAQREEAELSEARFCAGATLEREHNKESSQPHSARRQTTNAHSHLADTRRERGEELKKIDHQEGEKESTFCEASCCEEAQASNKRRERKGSEPAPERPKSEHIAAKASESTKCGLQAVGSDKSAARCLNKSTPAALNQEAAELSAQAASSADQSSSYATAPLAQLSSSNSATNLDFTTASSGSSYETAQSKLTATISTKGDSSCALEAANSSENLATGSSSTLNQEEEDEKEEEEEAFSSMVVKGALIDAAPSQLEGAALVEGGVGQEEHQWAPTDGAASCSPTQQQQQHSSGAEGCCSTDLTGAALVEDLDDEQLRRILACKRLSEGCDRLRASFQRKNSLHLFEELPPLTEGEPMRHMSAALHLSDATVASGEQLASGCGLASQSGESGSSASLRAFKQVAMVHVGLRDMLLKRNSQDETTTSCSSSTSLTGESRSPTRRRSSTVSQCSSVLSEGTRNQLNFDLSPDLAPDSSLLEANALSPTPMTLEPSSIDRPASPEPSSAPLSNEQGDDSAASSSFDCFRAESRLSQQTDNMLATHSPDSTLGDSNDQEALAQRLERLTRGYQQQRSPNSDQDEPMDTCATLLENEADALRAVCRLSDEVGSVVVSLRDSVEGNKSPGLKRPSSEAACDEQRARGARSAGASVAPRSAKLALARESRSARDSPEQSRRRQHSTTSSRRAQQQRLTARSRTLNSPSPTLSNANQLSQVNARHEESAVLSNQQQHHHHHHAHQQQLLSSANSTCSSSTGSSQSNSARLQQQTGPNSRNKSPPNDQLRLLQVIKLEQRDLRKQGAQLSPLQWRNGANTPSQIPQVYCAAKAKSSKPELKAPKAVGHFHSKADSALMCYCHNSSS